MSMSDKIDLTFVPQNSIHDIVIQHTLVSQSKLIILQKYIT